MVATQPCQVKAVVSLSLMYANMQNSTTGLSDMEFCTPKLLIRQWDWDPLPSHFRQEIDGEAA